MIANLEGGANDAYRKGYEGTISALALSPGRGLQIRTGRHLVRLSS